MPEAAAQDPAALAAVAARYRLVLAGRRYRGRFGDRRGSGVGSSLEFQDFRDYAPGDDLRHLDWRGYARSEQLRVRLHREEIAPHVDVLVDDSASMAATPAKAAAAQALLQALLLWSRQAGCAARLLRLGGGPVLPAQLAFAAPTTAPSLPEVPLRPGGARYLLTDALWTADPAPLLQRLGAGAASLTVLQLLDPWEIAPSADTALVLVDCETGARREVSLDARTVAAYRERLDRLVAALRSAVLAQGGVHVRVGADALAAMCQRELLPAAVVEPA